MIKTNTSAHLSIIAGNLLFGLNYSYSKSVISGGVSPLALAELRIVVAAILFIIVAKVLGNSLKVERKDMLKLAIGGVLGVVINQLLFLKGLQFTSPVDASIITTSNPLIVLLISAIFIGEKVTAVRLIGICIGAVGALMVIVNGAVVSFGADQLAGNAMILVCAIAYAGYLVWIKPMMLKYSAMTVMAWIFSIGAIISTPLCTHDLVNVEWSAINPETFKALAFVLIGATFAAYFFIGYGLKRISPATVSMYNYSQPIIAAIFAIMRGQDTFSTVKLMAAILVFFGVFIVVKSDKMESVLHRFHWTRWAHRFH